MLIGPMPPLAYHVRVGRYCFPVGYALSVAVLMLRMGVWFVMGKSVWNVVKDFCLGSMGALLNQ